LSWNRTKLNQLEVTNMVARNIFNIMKKLGDSICRSNFCSTRLSYSPIVLICRRGWIRTSDPKYPF